ncbi:efflux RND transporter periplasmic adaptor subunit [Aquincola sp. S2]|uniref:Efflux RND transporter periplasmic adaptor subunit n=1 Tax=Pseudaquabacterium terrae TaxID=2732868 RepID=A0ABX2EBM1_9BURK|nr:efflux RND transporter periplasmic adaptor subunit [Aquabacterium terrae]NRF65986.1 efflux RND transporter periplasmic adaptor subunit [Aquabacterium terrae]
MIHDSRRLLILLAALFAAPVAVAQGAAAATPSPNATSAPGRPALTVQAITPQRSDWPLKLAAAGTVGAWQEAVISVEAAAGFRLVEVLVQVGERVKRGQLLARLSTDWLTAEVAATRASVKEAEALLAEATANADRARALQPTGVLSLQQTTQILTAEQTAKARLEALRARVKADEVRLAQTRIVAPDDGVISARLATEGAMAQPGQELFRLIRRERLEWRAEVPAGDLARLKPGVPALVTTPSGQSLKGSVRMVAPTVDPLTRNGLVYVDLAPGSDARPGMFVRGEFAFGSAPGLTLPQTAVLLRDGFSYVHRLGPDNRVALTKVAVGRRVGDRIEITNGITPEARVVSSGGAFLADGDLVKVVQ